MKEPSGLKQKWWRVYDHLLCYVVPDILLRMWTRSVLIPLDEGVVLSPCYTTILVRSGGMCNYPTLGVKSMSFHKEALRESFDRCGETCPKVDSLMDDTLSDIKEYISPVNWDYVEDRVKSLINEIKTHGTELLRGTLITALEDLFEAKREVQDLEEENKRLKDQISDMCLS